MITTIFSRWLNLICPYVFTACLPAKTGIHVAHSRLGACFYFIAKQSVTMISTVPPPPSNGGSK